MIEVAPRMSFSYPSNMNPKKPATSQPRNQSNDDLTSLSWLQSLDMGGVVPHLAAPPTPPASPPLGQERKYEPVPVKIDYAVDGSVKPPYSYAALIGMAMKENENKMTLSAIYKWIKEHFVYYKTADQSWQNSIRHNLSLNKCFMKVARAKDEPGKGGFWKLDPEYAESLVDGVFKKRRPTKGTSPPTTKTKRIRRPFSLNDHHRLQNQIKQKQTEEQLRQKEQDEAVRNLLQPVQAAFMPPPTDKPPVIYVDQNDGIARTMVVDENGRQVGDDFVWSAILGEDCMQDDAWGCSSQEIITDLTHSGDPSTYQISTSPCSSTISLPTSSPTIVVNYNGQTHTSLADNTQLSTQTLPSFELSPESLGVEENLFGTPAYSETSNDAADCLMPSLDLDVGLDLSVTTDNTWDPKNTDCVYSYIQNQDVGMNSEPSIRTEISMDTHTSQTELVHLQDIEGNITQLTPLEPAAPVVVQQLNNNQWNGDQMWDEAKSMSLLEANLDFEKLIDMEVF